MLRARTSKIVFTQPRPEADIRWTKASEPLVVWKSEIVDLGAPQELQQEITAGTQTWIEQFRATPRAKYPDVKPIEHRGRAANEGQLVNRGGTIEAGNADGGAKFTITLPAA